MAHLFSDGSVTYNSTDHKFEDVKFTAMTPFKYTDAATFKKSVDNSIAGEMRDCAECHVGGGAMEYVPALQPELRVPLRNLGDGTTAATVNGTTIGQNDYTAFNYFIDQYGLSGNGSDATFQVVKNDYNATGVLEMDCFICHLDGYSWLERKDAVRKGEFDASRAAGAGLGAAVNGTTVDYDSNKVVADANGNLKLASAVVAAIKETPPTNNCASCHQGHTALEHGTPTLLKQVDWKKRGDQWIETNEAEVHLGLGCMGCHKRKSTDTVIGTTGFGGPGASNMGQKGLNGAVTQANVLSMCDPAKGDTNFEALANPLDATMKSCRNCHYNQKDAFNATGGHDSAGLTDAERFNAPNPDAAHAASGLTATKVQMSAKAGFTAGVANASHIDLISCEACHSRKQGGVTGNAVIDGSGTDEQGRLADHENPYLARNMEDNFIFTWYKGQVIPGNFSASLMVREMDWTLDANKDGRAGGLDPLLQTHIANINKAKFGSTASITEYYMTHTGSNYTDLYYPEKYTYTDVPNEVDAADIENRMVALRDGLSEIYGIGNPESTGDRAIGGYPKLKLSFMMAPFSINHNVSKAHQARGAGGCTDCHGNTSGGIWGGAVETKGDSGLKINWSNDGTPRGMQVVPFTQVNGSTEKTDFHPNVMNKTAERSIAYMFAAGKVNPTTPRTTLTPVPRGATLYETTFKTRDTAWKDTLTATNLVAPVDVIYPEAAAPSINWPNGKNMSTQGWIFKIEVADTNGTPVKTYTRQIGTYFLNAQDMLDSAHADASKGLVLIKDTPHFTIAALDTYNLQITAKEGFKIRLDPASDAGSFGMGSELWTQKIHSTTDNGIKATNGSFYTGRDAWVSYLNALAQPPVANVSFVSATDVPGGGTTDAVTAATSATAMTVTQNQTIYLKALSGGADTYTYKWTATDGGAAIGDGRETSRIFTKTGTYILTLTVTNDRNEVKTDAIYVKVAAPASTAAVTWTADDVTPTVFDGTLGVTGLPTHTKITVAWSDYTATTTNNGAGDHTVAHTFVALSSRLVDTNSDGVKDTYRYPVTVRAYNNTTLVKTITVYVDIAKP